MPGRMLILLLSHLIYTLQGRTKTKLEDADVTDRIN
jgi:hypothetical protein